MTNVRLSIAHPLRAAVLCAVAIALFASAPAHGAGAVGPTGPAGSPGLEQPADPAVVSVKLRKRIRRIAGTFSGASGVYVYDLTAQSVLAARNAGTKRILASNAKLFTTAAILDRFTATGRLRTTIYTDGTIAGGVLTGNIYLRGGGDPLFGSAAYIGKRFASAVTVEQLAGQLALTGITEITGRVFGDETALDAKRGTAKYGFRRSGEIGGQLSGLAFDKGLTGSGRSWQSDPPRYAAVKLRNALEDAGVRIEGSVGVNATPVTATAVTSIDSPSIGRLIALTNKPSDNYLAEMLFKDLALGNAPGSVSGSSASGAATVRSFALGLGSRVSLSDGSGLSRLDRAAPREVVDLLRGLHGRPDFETFYDSLSVPGVDGTLHKRMRGTAASKSCAAKTGTLSNVSTLSGYCTTAGGHLVAFSILQNAVWPYGAHKTQDRLVTTLASVE